MNKPPYWAKEGDFTWITYLQSLKKLKMEFKLDIQLLYWHWLVIGMILVVGEIFNSQLYYPLVWLRRIGGWFGGDVHTHVTKYSNSGLDGILSIIYCGLV